MKYIRKVSDKIGMDGTIAITVLTRLIQVGGGVISIFFIAQFLNLSEQGYYYTFASILAVQIFFELGLSGILTQYVAHEFAHLKWSDEYDLLGDEYYKSRLSSLLRFCVKWFGVISISLFFILLAAGFYFFNTFNKGMDIQWQLPWVLLCLSTSLNLFIDPLLAYFDGLGQVKDMATVRLIQKSAFVILMFIFFVCGFKLYASALASLIGVILVYIQILASNKVALLKKVWNIKGEWVVNYKKEIFPLQWKIALSWISGYFIFQFFNPVLFATEGPIVAGQMGMTLQALNGIASLSMSWVTTKIPLFSQYIALCNYSTLNSVFKKTLKDQMSINFVLLVMFIVAVTLMYSYRISYSVRFLSIIPTILMSVVCFINQLIFSWATYLRCHKEEPFLWNSIGMGILSILSTLILGHYFGLKGIIYGYTTITIIVALPWAYLIFKNKRSAWQS